MAQRAAADATLDAQLARLDALPEERRVDRQRNGRGGGPWLLLLRRRLELEDAEAHLPHDLALLVGVGLQGGEEVALAERGLLQRRDRLEPGADGEHVAGAQVAAGRLVAVGG